ncbi:hypothetical protein [Streptomyces boncukensis]|uniref:Uncharacterized protein n=1 Tax=Streptomyces boncukensis TaxID=2711219 RepID=A0A6G4WY37_9ACTN|nr:hypothetical protein [Streptomyces boncukensis]NGO70209.1 hypothetical protein [Streptomyces boncukensis]
MRLVPPTPLLHRPGPWASVFVDTSHTAEDAAHRQWLQAREVRARLAEQGADDGTQQAVQDALSGPVRTDAGLAVFAVEGRVVHEVPLPAAPSGPVCRWAALPHLAPLVGLGGGEAACLVAYVDRTGAELELRGRPGGIHALGQVRGQEWPVHRTGRKDWSERHWQFAVENTWETSHVPKKSSCGGWSC